MKGSNFIFYCVDLLYYRLHKVSLNRGGSYIDSPQFIKNKKSAINLQNKDDDECLRYAIIAALKYAEINNNPDILYVPYNTVKIRSAYVSKYNK